MEKLYVQYGCGLSAPLEWINFDSSPTLRLQKIPLFGILLKPLFKTAFPNNVRYGDIIIGLPFEPNSCDGLYCSHILEHLSFNDFRKALKNSNTILKKDGIFRCIVPDLEFEARKYIKELDNGNSLASINFMNNTLLGIQHRQRGVKGFLKSFFGNSHHLWMWDFLSLKMELEAAGFTNIRRCRFNDSSDTMFQLVESSDRFIKAVAIECIKSDF